MIRSLLVSLTLVVLATVPAPAADFDHAAHQGYLPGEPCATCHVEGAASIVPEAKVCQNCHEAEFVAKVSFPGLKTHGPAWGLSHRPFAKGNAVDCAACHQQNFCLECHKSGFADEQGAFGNAMNNVHRSDFHVTHPIAARTDPQLCSSCHENRFCADCHDGFRFRTGDIGGASHRRTFDLGFPNADITAIHAGISNIQLCDACHAPGSVAPNIHTWQTDHAREARKNLASCQACHPDGNTCLKCHSAKSGVVGFNPHPKDWNDFKDRLKRATDGRTCRKCH